MLAMWYPIELLQRVMNQPDMRCLMVVVALMLWSLASRAGKR